MCIVQVPLFQLMYSFTQIHILKKFTTCSNVKGNFAAQISNGMHDAYQKPLAVFKVISPFYNARTQTVFFGKDIRFDN